MASLETRLVRLEERLTPPVNEDQLTKDLHMVLERAAPFAAGWSVLAPTMDPAHVERVDAVFLDAFHWGRMREGSPLFLTFHPGAYSDDPLVKAVGRIVRDGVSGRQSGPFTLPLAVSSIYASEDISANDQCGACGYNLPAPHFQASACPVCEGPIGCNLYYRQHRAFAPHYQVPASVIDETREYLTPLILGWLKAGPGDERTDR